MISPIYTKRLLIREHIVDDLPTYHNWLSDAELMRYIGFPATQTIEQSFVRLAKEIDAQTHADRKIYFLAVTLKSTGQMIGDCGITVENRQQDSGIGYVGYVLLKEHWGKGYATEILEALIKFAFDELKLHKVIACCDAENQASKRVMQKCVMVKEAHLGKCRYREGIWADELQYVAMGYARLI